MQALSSIFIYRVLWIPQTASFCSFETADHFHSISQKTRTAFVVTSDRIITIITDLLTVYDQFLNIMLALSIIVFFLLMQRLQL